MLTTKRNRSGFADDAKQNLFTECDLEDFILSADPHSYLSSFNKFNITATAKEMLKDIKFTNDLEAICSDLKVCGRKEYSDLLKLKYNYGVKIGRAAKEEREARKAGEGEVEMT